MTFFGRFIPVLMLVVLLAMPAVVSAQEATPTSGVTVNTLGSVVIPGEAIPSGEVEGHFVRITLLPGVVLDLPSTAPERAVIAVAQTGGAMKIRKDSAFRIWRHDGAVEDVPANTEVLLSTGDTVLVLDGSGAVKISTEGAEPAVLLEFYLTDGAPPIDPAWNTWAPPAGFLWEDLNLLNRSDWTTSGVGIQSFMVTFQQRTIAAGESLEVPPGDPIVLRYVESGRLTWTFERPGDAATPARPVTHYKGFSVPWMALDLGEQIVLTNQETDPLVLLEVVLSPALDSGTPTS